MKNVLCQISGGADSTLAALLAMEKYEDAHFFGIFFNYSQICVNQECKAAKCIARKLCLSLLIVDINNLWTIGGMIDGESEEGISVYTPMRNAVFATLSMAYADSIQADVIITGSKGFDKTSSRHSYYDSTKTFHILAKTLWEYTTEDKREVHFNSILTNDRKKPMSKEEVYIGLESFGFYKEDTWSCFRGEVEECGECTNCIEKEKIYQKIKGTKK